MIKNPKALMTMVRNRLTSPISLEEKTKWFYDKGISVTEKNNTYYLKSDIPNITSELTDVCNNVIFHDHRLVAFPGWPINLISLDKLKKDKNFIFDNTTIFIKPIEDGQTIYMYWDPIDNEWKFSSPKKIISPHKDIILKNIQNIMSGEYCYTYVLKLVETGKEKGLYLESLFDHERFKEEDIKRVVMFAQKFGIKYPKLYILENGNEIEESDLPIIVKDISGHKYKITSLL